MKAFKPACLAGMVMVAAMHVASADEAMPGQALEAFAPLGQEELANHRGADNTLVIVSSQQEMSAGVKGTTFVVGAMNNGNIRVGDRAFEGYSGLGINVLNTGNGNAFSTGISMTVHLH